MAMRGVHLAIEDRHLDAMRSLTDENELFNYVGDLMEELFDSEFDAETDKAWGLIHQTLIQENPCIDDLERRAAPLSCVIMGEETLSDSDWFIVTLTSSATVPRVQEQLEPLTRHDFENQLRSLLQIYDCPDVKDEDVSYAGHWFENMKRVFDAARRHRRHVIFTADY